MTEPRRFYGTDSTEELESIAEVTVEEDGSTSLQVVLLDKSESGGTTETGDAE